MAETTVSVVIPTFDRAGLLTRAVDSVLRQSRPPDEVIIVDDGSTDDTAEMLGKRYPDVQVLSQENRGVSAARNLGIQVSTGEWIALLDSDDAWLPLKLERQLRALECSPGFRICHAEEIWIRRGRRVNPRKKHRKKGGWIYQDCLPLCAISPSSVMLHRSIFEEAGGFDEQLPACEDYDLWLRVCSRWPVLLVDEALVLKYGGHADQLSSSIWGLDRFRIRALEKIVDEGNLTPGDLQATLEALVGKLEIYIGGAAKRGRAAEVGPLIGRLDDWKIRLEACGK